MITTLFFDVFGTILNLDEVPKTELHDYLKHIQQPVWSPLELPEHWKKLPAHPDAYLGLRQIASKYRVVALTNAPLHLTVDISRHNDLQWDAIVPLECIKNYKPDLECYIYAMKLLGVTSQESVMVTANRTFGDIESAKVLGMHTYWIDRNGGKTLYDLVAWLDSLKE